MDPKNPTSAAQQPAFTPVRLKIKNGTTATRMNLDGALVLTVIAGNGAVSLMSEDLSQKEDDWLLTLKNDEAAALGRELLRVCGQDGEQAAATAAQPDINAELLEALKGMVRLAVNQGFTHYALEPGREFDAVKAARALITKTKDATAAQPAIPEGYALVPLKPTAEMLIRGGEAFFDAAGREGTDGDTLNDQGHADSIYRAMVAAGPATGATGAAS